MTERQADLSAGENGSRLELQPALSYASQRSRSTSLRRDVRLRANATAQTFIGGAGPAAVGAILGSTLPLARALTRPWQYVVLGGAVAVVVVAHRSPVAVLLAAAAVGIIAAAAGVALPP